MAELNNEEPGRDSVFHPDNVQAFTLMTLLQMRDIAYLQLYVTSGDHKEKVDHLEAEHAAGRILFPPPFMA